MRQERSNRILIVNDNPDQLDLMALMLRQAGYEIKTAVDGRDAFEIAGREVPDLIISDVSMPVVDGIELCRLIRADERLRSVPIMLVSAHRKDTQSVIEGLTAGADDYLEAPYEPARLVAKMSRLLERKRAEERLHTTESLLRLTTEQMPALLWTTDKELKVTSATGAGFTSLGLNPEQFIGRNVADLLKSDADVQLYLDKHFQALKNQTVSYESIWMGRAYEVHVEPFRLNNAVVGIIGLAHDITERKRAEEALRESERAQHELARRQSVILNALPANICLLDHDGNIVEVNDAWRAFASANGFRGKDYGIGRNYLEVCEQAIKDEDVDLSTVIEGIRRILAGQSDLLEYEYACHSPDQKCWFRLLAAPAHEEQASSAVILHVDITELKLRTEAIRFQARLLDTVGQAVIATDLNWIVTYWNHSAEKLYGWSAAEAVGRDVTKLIPAQSQEQASEIMPRLRAGEVWSGEFLIQCQDGTTVPVFTTNSPVFDEEGKLIGIIGVATDITQRKQDEEFRSLLAAIVESSDDAIIGKTLEGAITSWNKGAERLYGYSAEEVIGRHISILVPPDRPAEVDEFHDKLRRGERITHFETVRVAKDGSPVDVLLTCSPIRDAKGSIIGASTIAHDITSRKRNEERISRSESLLAEAQRLSHLGSWEWDLKTNTVIWSDEHYNIMGHRPQSFNVTFDMFLAQVHPADRELIERVTEKALKDHAPFSYYYRIIRPDESIRVLNARGAVVLDENGRPVRMYGTAQDVTERRKADEQLQKSYEQLRALSARLESVREEESLRIARELHDELGGALTALKMDLSLLKKRLLNIDGEAALQRINSMSTFIDETIQTVRNISTELRPPVLDDLGLPAAIEWQAQEFQKRTGIRCEIASLWEDGLDAKTSTALFRIFQEILTNVARHAQATRVKVALERTDDRMHLRVSDNGRGITQSEVSHPKSLGILGMRERALLLGGQVSFSGVTGKGTTISVHIPLRSEGEAGLTSQSESC